MRSTANQSTNSGGVGWPSACSIARQPPISISPRRSRPRTTASMRSRVARVQARRPRRSSRAGQALRQLRASAPAAALRARSSVAPPRSSSPRQRRAAPRSPGRSGPSHRWRAGTDLLAHQREEAPRPAPSALVRHDALAASRRPAARAPHARRLLQRVHRPPRRRRPDPRSGASGRARGCRPPPSAPSSQRRSSAVSCPVSSAGEGAVGGVEQMMALVEDIARRRRGRRRSRRRPPSAAWIITSAWLAMTISARRARRTLRSMKQRR